MDTFTIYFDTGWQHIISTGALDHILFIIALTAIHSFRSWKQVLILVTAFTIGHSLTLALSVYDVIRFNSTWVEFLIPVTIIITALFNLLQRKETGNRIALNYFFALFFGLIHGMGFANTIRFMLAESQEIGWPLLSFNLGIEAGQLVLVFFILLCHYLLVRKAGLNQKVWIILLSSVAFIISLYMAVTRWPL